MIRKLQRARILGAAKRRRLQLLLVKGRVSRDVHYHIRKYAIEELPQIDVALNEWLHT